MPQNRREFLHADERGSVIAVSDDAGAMTAWNRYDEYGRPQSGNYGLYGYTGQLSLGYSGLPELTDYKARNYLPRLGIFGQTDPIGYAESANLYAYVLSDPINLSDPLGLGSCAGATVCACRIPGHVRIGDYCFAPQEIIVTPVRHVYSPSELGGRTTGPGNPKPTSEERRRGQCNAFQQDAARSSDTSAAATVADLAELVSTGADAVAAIAVFVPGGQSVAAGAKGLSDLSQFVEAGANIYVGARTGNWSAWQGQKASLATSLVVGKVASRSLRASGIPGRMGPAARRARTGAFGDAVGNVFGDASGDLYCGHGVAG